MSSKVLKRIQGSGRGAVLTPASFSDLGTRETVAKALERHTRAGILRLIGRGLYHYPVRHPRLGLVAPETQAIADALAQRDAVRLQPAGEYAANVLGLTEQIPSRVVFLTDGPTRRLKLGPHRELVLKRSTPRTMKTAGRTSGTVFQALRFIGRTHVDARVLGAIRRRLSEEDQRTLKRDARYAPAWIGALIPQLVGEEDTP